MIHTHIDHRDLLRTGTRPWVVGSIGQHTIGMFYTHVLVQMALHLLPLFPAEILFLLFHT